MTEALDARWQQVADMPPDEWQKIAARVSMCLDCRGPALLTDDELQATIAAPMCTRCRRAAEEAA